MTAVDSVVEALREDILEGRLDAGRPLRETALAERFGVNRHTLRAALQVLASERLISFEAYRGARVRVFDDAAVIALLEYRTAIEVEAARLMLVRTADTPSPVPRSVVDANDSLRRACSRPSSDPRAIEQAHAALHHAIVAAAESPRLLEAHSGLLAELGLFMVQLRSVLPPAEMLSQHDRLVDALGSGPAAAEAELRAHLRHSTAQLLALRS